MSLRGKNARDQRRENAYLVLKVVRENRGISRNNLAQKTGLSIPAISQIVEYLSDLMLLKSELGIGKTQKKIPLFSFRGDRYAMLGLQIKRSSVSGIGSNLNGKVFKRFSFTYRSDDLDRLFRKIFGQVEALQRQAKSAGMHCLGLGIGSPGPVDYANRKIIMTTHFHNWNEISLGLKFERRLQIPVILEKNPNLCAYAEHSIGAGRNSKSIIYVEISSGIGLAIIYNEKIFKGNSNIYCEIGHTSVNNNGPQCECGNNGCLETYAKEAVVEAKLHEAKTATDRDSILREAANYLAVGIGNIISLTGVSTIIVGGRLIQNHPKLFHYLAELVPQRTFPRSREHLEIRKSDLGKDAAALGGALWVGESALLHLNSALFVRESSKNSLQFERVV